MDEAKKFNEGELVLMFSAAAVGDITLFFFFPISFLLMPFIAVGNTTGFNLFFTMPLANLILTVLLIGWNIFKFKDIISSLEKVAESSNMDPAKMASLLGPQIVLFVGLILGLIIPIKGIVVLLVGFVTNTKIGQMLLEVGSQVAVAAATGGAGAVKAAGSAALKGVGKEMGKEAAMGVADRATGGMASRVSNIRDAIREGRQSGEGGGEGGAAGVEAEGGATGTSSGGGGGSMAGGAVRGRSGGGEKSRDKENEGEGGGGDEKTEKEKEMPSWEREASGEKRSGVGPLSGKEVAETFMGGDAYAEPEDSPLPGQKSDIMEDGNSVNLKKAA